MLQWKTITYLEQLERSRQGAVGLHNEIRLLINVKVKILTEDGGLSSIIEPDDDNSHLLIAQETFEKFGKDKAHF